MIYQDINQGRIVAPLQGPPYQVYGTPNSYSPGPQMRMGNPQGLYFQSPPQMPGAYQQAYNAGMMVPQGQYQQNYGVPGQYQSNQCPPNFHNQQGMPQYQYQQGYNNMPNQPQTNPYFNQAQQQGFPQQMPSQGNPQMYQQYPVAPQNPADRGTSIHPINGYYAPSPSTPTAGPPRGQQIQDNPQRFQNAGDLVGPGVGPSQQYQQQNTSTIPSSLLQAPGISPPTTGSKNASPLGRFVTPPIPAPYQPVLGSQGTAAPVASTTQSASTAPELPPKTQETRSTEVDQTPAEPDPADTQVPERTNTIARSATTISSESQSIRISPQITDVSLVEQDPTNRETATASPVSDVQTSRTQSIRDQTGSLKRAREQQNARNLAIPNDMASRSTEKFRPEEFYQLVEERSNDSSSRQSMIQDAPASIQDTGLRDSSLTEEETDPTDGTGKRNSLQALTGDNSSPLQNSVHITQSQCPCPSTTSPTSPRSPSHYPLPDSTLTSPTSPQTPDQPPTPPPKILEEPPLPPPSPIPYPHPPSTTRAAAEPQRRPFLPKSFSQDQESPKLNTSRPPTPIKPDSQNDVHKNQEEASAARLEESEEEEEIVMSSTAFPGDTWEPTGYGQWEGD
jgi:hypothetical protein